MTNYSQNHEETKIAVIKVTFLAVLSLILIYSGIASATDITPDTTMVVNGPFDPYGNGDWWERSQESTETTAVGGGYLIAKHQYQGFNESSHPQGTWNSPYTAGVDGYGYNDPQDYIANGRYSGGIYTAGPHGGYLTSTHKCRECHAVHRAAGKFKLTRSDTRYEVCDWCHGSGAGSGYNIQTDNDEGFTREFNVGHTMGFGVISGKWRAPDDTYPAFAPEYWLGGFSCLDCHSPHANPARLLGFKDDGSAWGEWAVANPGHDDLSSAKSRNEPVYPPGSWLLIKNPDRELAVTTDTFSYYQFSEETNTLGTIVPVTIYPGDEIIDLYAAYQATDADTIQAGLLKQYTGSDNERYAVNKIATDWNTPIGLANSSQSGQDDMGYRTRNTSDRIWSVSEFCTDCHDGNAGLHTIPAPLFSEERALRDQGSELGNWTGNYEIAYGHDAQPRQCKRQMVLNPEDQKDFGPQCRSCHRGSSDCGACHSDDQVANGAFRLDNASTPARTYTVQDAASNVLDTTDTPGIQGISWFGSDFTAADGYTTLSPSSKNNPVLFKHERSVDWSLFESAFGENWRQSPDVVTTQTAISDFCSSDGFSWPHRTLGWKMLKDDLFGLDFDGTPVGPGEHRNANGTSSRDSNYASVVTGTGILDEPAHDYDSVCLDCHNPTIWNETSSKNHTDTPDNPADDYDDELILRGLP